MSAVKIVDLLRMASGVAWTENTNDWQTDVADNYIKAIAARRPDYVLNYVKTLPAADPPGTQYFYNTGDTLLLSYILRRATGMTAAEYCSERSGSRSGASRTATSSSSPTRARGRGQLLRRDPARLRQVGHLHARRRRHRRHARRAARAGWRSRRPRPRRTSRPTWPAGAGIQPDTPASEFTGYGYLWWLRGGGDYQALGSYGQWIYISPSARTVAVLLGAVPRGVYMSPAQLAQHAESEHLGSEMRTDFVKAAIAALA